MIKKLKVGILMGGPSKERSVSLVTGKAIADSLDKNRYTPIKIEYGKDYKFYLKNNSKRRSLNLSDLKKKVDIVFIALHGTIGEDGGVQGLLESLNVKYTGSKILSSALAMNKVLSSKIYKEKGLITPDFVDIKKSEWGRGNKNKLISKIYKKIKFPCVIKPVDQGSAIGVKIVKEKINLEKVLNNSFKEFDWVMVQKFINGREATCGVLEKNKKLIILPPTYILPVLGEFYDFRAKYAKGGSKHICPADFSEKQNKELQNQAKLAHEILDCRGMSRTDFFIEDKTNKIYIIETNTIPGMTPTSLLPEASAKAGISFGEMLDLIIKSSL